MSGAQPVPAEAASARGDRIFDVVMLTTVHSATDDRIFYREAKALVEAGMSVCVMGPFAASQELDGVWIDALDRQTSRLRRLLLGWTVLKRTRYLQGRVFVFHDPELFGVALILRLTGRKVVYDCHENLPMQVLQKRWIPRPFRWALVPWTWLAEWTASRLICGVISAREAVLPRFPRHRRVLVQNFPARAVLDTAVAGAPVGMRRDVVIYAGGLSRLRGIGELVEAFRGPELSGAELWLAGNFESAAFQEEILTALPPNAKWLGWREHPYVLQLYPYAKIGVNLLYPTPSHRNAQPVKLYEYLGAGLPVVTSDFPEYRELIEGCGIAVDPRNVGQIRHAIRQLLDPATDLETMSQTGRNRILKSFCWEGEAKRLVAFCSRLAWDE